jgi:hypothetical protein
MLDPNLYVMDGPDDFCLGEDSWLATLCVISALSLRPLRLCGLFR